LFDLLILFYKDRKIEKQKDRKREKQKGRKTERQKDRKTERQKNRMTERQKNRKTEKQKDRKTERKKRSFFFYILQRQLANKTDGNLILITQSFLQLMLSFG